MSDTMSTDSTVRSVGEVTADDSNKLETKPLHSQSTEVSGSLWTEVVGCVTANKQPFGTEFVGCVVSVNVCAHRFLGVSVCLDVAVPFCCTRSEMANKWSDLTLLVCVCVHACVCMCGWPNVFRWGHTKRLEGCAALTQTNCWLS